jgi:hypothetical protein
MDAELMTLSAIKQDPWIAVIMPIPRAADLRLLAAARRAARCCEREAQAAPASPPDEIDEMRYFADQASLRVGEINVRAALVLRRRPAAARLNIR